MQAARPCTHFHHARPARHAITSLWKRQTDGVTETERKKGQAGRKRVRRGRQVSEKAFVVVVEFAI